MAAPSPPTNPFKALEAYSRRDRGRLFGRDGDLCLILDRLLANRTTLLFAGSGVGKTSFLNAKVVPDLEDRYFVVQHARWASEEPLRAVHGSLMAALRARGQVETATSSGEETLVAFYRGFRPGRSLLVLDQFEELFQHHRDTAAFDKFIDAMTELINADGIDVRVLFSMREEFLGELSVFDNRIPDLFNNYYRLKNPTDRQSKEIIALTCDWAKVACDRAGLDALVDELLTVHVGLGARAPRRRDQVSPPFLQIVCHRLWEAQFQTLLPSKTDGAFLARFTPGGARRELKGYCRGKLGSLPAEQQDLAADAFAYLMTRQGAKMAYELSALAEHMEVDETELRETLGAIARPDVRILRESPGPGGATWFELYHDMYAPFLSEWRAEQLTDRRRRQAEEARRRTEREVVQRVSDAHAFARALVISVFTLFMAPLVLPILLWRAGQPLRTCFLAGLGWLAGWFGSVLAAVPIVLLVKALGGSEEVLGGVSVAVILVGGPLGSALVFWKIAPRAEEVGRRSAIEYLFFGLVALLANFQYALTPRFSIDLSPVTALLVVFAAYRFGPTAAGISGGVVAAIGLMIGFLLPDGSGLAPLIRGARFGPLQIPHSSLADILRLVLLGLTAGWLFDRVRGYLSRRGVEWAEIVGPPSSDGAGAFRATVDTIAAGILILVTDVVFMFSPGPTNGTFFLPPRNLVVLVALVAGYRLGPQLGALAAAVAMVAAWLAGPFIVGPFAQSWFFTLDYRQAGHIASLAAVAYWGGLAARIAGTRVLADFARTRPAAPALGVRRAVAGVASLILLLAASLYIRTEAPGPTLRVGFEPFIGVSAAMLLGVALGGRRAAWLAGAGAIGMNFLLGPMLSGLLPTWDLSLIGRGSLRLGSWSAMGIATLAATAWLAGRLGVRDSADRRRWLAIAAFAVLELPSVLQTGTFPRAYVSGMLFGWDVSLVTGPLRVLEPLVVALVVGAITERFARRATAGPSVS